APGQRAGTQEATLPLADGRSPRADEVPPRAPAGERGPQGAAGTDGLPRGSGDAASAQRAGTQGATLTQADGSSPRADDTPPHAPGKEGSGMKIETELEDIYLRRMNEASGMAHAHAGQSPDSRAERAAAAERSEWKDGSTERSRQGTAEADLDDVIQRTAPMSVQDMFRGAMSPVDAMFAGSTEQISTAPGPDMELLENVVERILVSAPEQGGQEVRLSIHSDALRSTEITIRRDAEGRLSVGMDSADQATFQTLVSAQGELKKILEASEKAEVRVTVTGGARDAHPEQNDSRQRSRGYFAQYGQDEQ
ncbi:MAG: hypothetical protein J6P53_07395, partial [Mailhella sp.]|nr:hypothetical protein [Mailhella sp.]